MKKKKSQFVRNQAKSLVVSNILSTFADDKIIIYICSFVISISALIVGLVLTNKRKKGN